jgi:hypothetical protein
MIAVDGRNWFPLGPYVVRLLQAATAARSPCRKLKLEHSDGVARPREGRKARGQISEPHANAVHPFAGLGAFGLHCNIVDTNSADVEGAVLRKQRSGRGIPIGSSR